MTNAAPIAFLVDSSGVPLRQGVVVDAATGAPTIITINPATGLPVSTVVGSGGGGAFATITGQPSDNANLSTALASKQGTPINWAASGSGGTPTLTSGTAVLGTAYRNTTAGVTNLSPTIDGIPQVAFGDVLLGLVAGTYTLLAAGGGYLGSYASTATLQTAYPAVSNTASVALVTGLIYQSNGAAWIQQITSTQVGVAGGVASLDGTTHIPTAQIPAPTSTTLGGVQSVAPVTHQYVMSISTAGVPALAQPSTGDLSDAAAVITTPITNNTNRLAQIGNPVAISVATTLADTHNGANLVATGTPALTLSTGRVAGFGCSIKGAFTLSGGLTIGSGVTDLRSTTGTAYCCLAQSDTTGAGLTYDLLGTK